MQSEVNPLKQKAKGFSSAGKTTEKVMEDIKEG